MKALQLYKSIGMPNMNIFAELLKRKYYRNCPVTPEDAKLIIKIWERDRDQIAGRLTRPRAKKVPLLQPSEEISTLIDQHPYTNIGMDYIYMMGVGFLHTVSIEYRFGTGEPVVGKKTPRTRDIVDQVKRVINLYESRGIKVTQAVCDNEFECIREKIRPTHLQIVGRNEHVGIIERRNSTLKEHVRSLMHMTPYKYFCTLMIIGAVTKATKDINNLPSQHGISDIFRPTSFDKETYQLQTSIPSPSLTTVTMWKSITER